MADYSQFGSLCEEWLNLVQDKSIVFPVVLLNTQEQRRTFRTASNVARCRASEDALKKQEGLDVTTQTKSILCRDFQEIGARVYWPYPIARSQGTKLGELQNGDSCKVLLYFHGGGFLSGNLSTEDGTCVQ